MINNLPPDVLRTLVYMSGLSCVEDRTALVLCCKVVLDACNGVDKIAQGRKLSRIHADGGGAHWCIEARLAGYKQTSQVAVRHGHRPFAWRTLFFKHKALRCACCDVVISHRTGRISTSGYQGRGVYLSSCVQCGPLVHCSHATPSNPPSYPESIKTGNTRVFGRYHSCRKLDMAIERASILRDFERAARREAEVREALSHTGLSPCSISESLVGSVAFAIYVTTVADDGVGLREMLDGTVLNICCRHWMNTYTWLKCAFILYGSLNSHAAENHLYHTILNCYGGYPPIWPWIQEMHEREALADMIVAFYADSMMLDSLFQRLVGNELYWMSDHGWLHRIRASAVRLGPSKKSHSGLHSRVTFITSINNLRVSQLMFAAGFVGGYRVHRSAWNVMITVT